MDGEHAFSASLTLVMVNVAFPCNERDASAMETALSVLRGMAEKGNEYIQARLALLMNIRATIGRRAPTSTSKKASQTAMASVPVSEIGGPVPSASFPTTASLPLQDSPLQLGNNFQPFQDVSLNFDIDDDPKLWEEISGNIDLDMDTSWLESAFRNEAYQEQPDMWS